jgi:uncharacterized membrane protein YeaQ/YmgE (transglycosylase-associated protein family)
MIGSIILAIIVGAVIGVVARLIMPGKQSIGMIMTVLLGAVGGLIGAALVGVVVAIILIAIYEAVTRRGVRARR